MSKIVLDNIASGYNLNKINANFDKIEAALNDQVLYRDVPVGETNTVKNTIDMDSNDLLNVGDLRVLGGVIIGGKNIDALNSALVWRGTWDSGTTYAESDAVYYLGTSYIATASNTNEAPPSPNWNTLAAQGDTGSGSGDVNGPASAINNNLVSFNAGTGKLIKDSGIPSSSVLVTSNIGVSVQSYDVDTAKTDVAQTFTAQQTPMNGTLTDGSTVNWNGNTNGQVVKLTTAAARTFNAPTNIIENNLYVLRLTTGGFTPSWNAAYKWATVPSGLENATYAISFIGGPSNTLIPMGNPFKTGA